MTSTEALQNCRQGKAQLKDELRKAHAVIEDLRQQIELDAESRVILENEIRFYREAIQTAICLLMDKTKEESQ